MRASNLTMYWHICFRFIDFMLKVKIFLNYTSLFSPNKFENNNKVILKYCQ